MLNAGQRRALCRQGEERQEAAVVLRPGRPAAPTRIARMIAATVVGRDHLHRDRDRGAAARSQSDQAVAAALQRAAARRQVVSLYPDHRRSLGAADPQASRRADAARATISGRSPRSARSIAPSPRCSAPSWCAPAPTRFSKAAPGPACCIRSSAAPAPAPARSISPAIPSSCARPRDFLSGRSRAVKQELAERDGKGLRRARIRDRGALSRPARGAVGDPVATGHQSAHASRRPTCSPCIRRAAIPASRCSSSAPGRTGATAPIFRARENRSRPSEVLASFLAQFYDDKPPPKLILLSHDIEERELMAEALSDQGRPQGRDSLPRGAAKRRNWSTTR